MSTFRNDRAPRQDFNQYQDDEDTISSDDWNPTPITFTAFLKRDFVLASNNVKKLMLEAGRPVTVKELKESSLHSVDVIDQVLVSMIASGLVQENKSRYLLVKV